MSVMTLTYDRSVSPDKYAQSAMSEKPVKYGIDPNAGVVPFTTFKSELPDLYVVYGNLAFYSVDGYLSHCWTDEYGMDVSYTQNTYAVDGAGYGPSVAMEWIADLLSDFTLTRGMYETGRIYGIKHERYGTCTVHAIAPSVADVVAEPLCLECGIDPAEPRDESVFQLCPVCAERLFEAVLAGIHGPGPNEAYVNFQAKYGWKSV